MSLKITETELTRVYQAWVDRFGNGRDNHDWRLGQYIFNEYAAGEDRFPSLFYEESASAAYAKAMTIIQGQN